MASQIHNLKREIKLELETKTQYVGTQFEDVRVSVKEVKCDVKDVRHDIKDVKHGVKSRKDQQVETGKQRAGASEETSHQVKR